MTAISPRSFDIHTLTTLVQRGLPEVRRGTALATGITALDAALPGGGLPEGKMVELCGSRASGKLSLALAIAARLLGRGEPVALIDPEGTARPDPGRDAVLGSLLVVRGGGLLIALRASDALLKCGAFALLVLDLSARDLPAARGGALLRLAGAARHTGTILVLLTEPRRWRADGLSALVTLRLGVRRGSGPFGRFLAVTIAKSKMGFPGEQVLIDLAQGQRARA